MGALVLHLKVKPEKLSFLLTKSRIVVQLKCDYLLPQTMPGTCWKFMSFRFRSGESQLAWHTDLIWCWTSDSTALFGNHEISSIALCAIKCDSNYLCGHKKIYNWVIRFNFADQKSCVFFKNFPLFPQCADNNQLCGPQCWWLFTNFALFYTFYWVQSTVQIKIVLRVLNFSLLVKFILRACESFSIEIWLQWHTSINNWGYCSSIMWGSMKLQRIEFYFDFYDTHAIAFFTSPMISQEAHGGTREA